MLAHEQPLYTPHSHQRLWEHKQHTYALVQTQTHIAGLQQHRNHLILKPTGDVTPEGFIYRLFWPQLPWDQVTILTPLFGFLLIK